MKKILIITSALIFVVFSVFIFVPYIVDVNDYKDEIVSLIKDKSGYNIDIKGKITLSVVPDIAFSLSDVAVKSFIEGEEDIITVSKLVLKVKIAPLFRKVIKVDSFRFESPVINLHKASDGWSNWLIPEGLPGDVNVAEPKVGADGAIYIAELYEDIHKGSLREMFQFNEIKITNGKFRFIDDVNKRDIKISDLNLYTSLRPDIDPFKISGKLDIFEDPKKGNFSIKGKYRLDGNKYNIENIVANFDDILAHSNIVLYTGSYKPDFKIALYLDKVNLNGYKLSGDEIEKQSEKVVSAPSLGYERKEKKFSWSKAPIDFSIINDVNLQVSIKSSGIIYRDISVGEIMVNGYLRNNRLILSLKEAEIYGGHVSGEVVIDNSGGPVNIRNKINIVEVDLAKVPESFLKGKALSGIFSGDLKLHSTGDNEKELIGKLDGSLSFGASDGSIMGVDLFSMVNNITAAFNLGSVSNKTKFNKISGAFVIVKGKSSNDNFVLKSDLLNFVGAGTVDLNDISIDYKLIPKYSQDFESDEQRGPNIPILVSGDLRHPIFRLEVKSIVADLIKNPKKSENLVKQLKRDFRAIKRNIKKDLGSDVLKDLRNIFE